MDFVKELFDLNRTKAKELLLKYNYPWDALAELKDFILYLCGRINKADYINTAPDVWVHKSAIVAPSAYLGAPCIVGAESEVRHGAYVRGGVLIGKFCVVGNSTELKNSILFDGVQVPHFNYTGDSVLGYKAHMGAGAIISNVKSDKSEVFVRAEGEDIPTRRKKFGALLGDFAEIGCNSVLNPGTVIGRSATVYPLSRVRGVVPPSSIFKCDGNVVEKL